MAGSDNQTRRYTGDTIQVIFDHFNVSYPPYRYHLLQMTRIIKKENRSSGSINGDIRL